MYHDFLSKLQEKYQYNTNLMIAIRLCLCSMIKDYGVENKEKVFNLFWNVKIFATNDFSFENIENIKKQMCPSDTYVDEKSNAYQTSLNPGAYYTYHPIIDDHVQVKEEIRWMVVEDLFDDDKASGYVNLFGTTINIPYFLHELNHAYVMQNPLYIKNNNQIFSKHGMVMATECFTKEKDQLYFKKIDDINNTYSVIAEEMINESRTQEQLISLLDKSNYLEVKEELKKIDHVSTNYCSYIISLASNLEKLAIGRDALCDYREHHNFQVSEQFNQVANQSSIALKYCNREKPWDYFFRKCYELYLLSLRQSTMSLEEYGRRCQILYIDAMASIFAYREVVFHTTNIEKYELYRVELMKMVSDNQEIHSMKR